MINIQETVCGLQCTFKLCQSDRLCLGCNGSVLNSAGEALKEMFNSCMCFVFIGLILLHISAIRRNGNDCKSSINLEDKLPFSPRMIIRCNWRLNFITCCLRTRSTYGKLSKANLSVLRKANLSARGKTTFHTARRFTAERIASNNEKSLFHWKFIGSGNLQT